MKDTELARLPPILLITRKHKMPLVRGHSKRLIEELYTFPDNPEVEISSPCCRSFPRMPNVRTSCRCQNLEICPHYCANENNLRYFQAFRNPNGVTHGCRQGVGRDLRGRKKSWAWVDTGRGVSFNEGAWRPLRRPGKSRTGARAAKGDGL